MPRRFESAVEAQIREAQERGAFDGLPGAGKPLPALDGPDDGLSWMRGFVRREGVPSEALLPTSLLLRREVERLPETVGRLRSERAVRTHLDELNARIREWIRIPLGPQVPLRQVDVEQVVQDWRAAREAVAPPPPGPTAVPAPPRRRWFRRR